MGGTLDEAAIARLARFGVSALDDADGLELFDRALAADRALLVTAAAGHARAAAARAVRACSRRCCAGSCAFPPAAVAARTGSLARRLALLPEAEWDAAVLQEVRTHVAAVLGQERPEAIDPGAAFKELGFDSLTAVELRNRLEQATGLRLPTTLVFDHPSTEAVARLVRERVDGTERAGRGDEPSAGRRADRDRGHELPPAGRRRLSRGAVAADDRRAATRSPTSRPTAAGTSSASTTPTRPRAGRTYARGGGFLDGAGGFDPAFFGMSPREAAATDPQQRLLLEATWEAFEHAGIDPATLRGSDTGVFAGVMYHDYGLNARSTADSEGYLTTGSAGSVASGRVAYTFGLVGPAVTIDTACSSSLVALHLACQALRSGECSLALAGGVTVMATPGVLISFARQRGLSPDGRCKAFGAGADGVGWGEGVGMLALERLSDAERNGHRVLAVVRGSAVNQDGASNGLTAPNGPVAGTRDPPGPGQRRARRRRRRRRRGPRHRHHARRPDRGPGPAGHLRAGTRRRAAAARLDQVQHRPRPGRRGRRGRDQDGHGAPARAAAADAARRRAVAARRLVGGRDRAAVGGRAVGAQRAARAAPASPRSASAAPTRT